MREQYEKQDQYLILTRLGHYIVFLKVPIEELVRRIADKEDRPSLTNKNFIEEINDIWKERKEKYIATADIVCECDSSTPEENAKKI